MIERLAIAASIAVRHASAYADLVLSDVDAAGRLLRRRMIAGATLAGALVLAIAIVAAWLVAATWDTAFRNWTFAGLFVIFTTVAGLALRWLQHLSADAPGMLSRTAREWAKDRALLEEILERERERAEAA